MSSLPSQARERYEAEQRKLQPQQPAQLTLATLAVQQPVASAPRVLLTDDAKREAEQKRDVIDPLLTWIKRTEMGQRPRGLRLQNGDEVRTQTDMIRWLAEQRNISVRTINRMLARYREGGEGALVKKVRSDAGKSRFFQRYPDAAAMVAYVAFGDGVFQAASGAACHRALVAQAWRLGIEQNDLPSKDTILRFIDSAPGALKVLARKGERKFGEICQPYIQRGYDERANQVWVADHMIADVEVQNDVFDDLPLGHPMRLKLSAIIDLRSRYFVGVSWTAEESSASITTSLRNAILKFGPPAQFYCDNGKGYRKVAAGAVSARYIGPDEDQTLYEHMVELEGRLGILARLGVTVTHCIAHHPQSKHIERAFRTVHEQYCKMWPTYTGGAPHLRPEITERLMTIHRRAIRDGRPEHSHHPLASDYIAGFELWLKQYHNSPHSGRGMDGRTPAEVFEQERDPQQRPVPQLLDLSCTFTERAVRTVDACAVRMFGDRYLPADGDDHALSCMLSLGGNDDSKVTVLFDRHDHQQLIVVDDYGRVLCTLVRQRLVAQAPHDDDTRAQIAAGRKQSLGALRATKGQLAAIRQVGRMSGARRPLELLADSSPSTPVSVMPDQLTQTKPHKVAAETAHPMYSHDVALAMDHLKETD